MSIPLLVTTDSPDLPSGLARIGRDLATRIHAHLPEFSVGYLGRGGIGSSRFPFPVYTIPHSFIGSGTSDEWGAAILPQVWKDFAGASDAPGIIFTIWDPARLLWLSRPEYLAADGPLKTFLASRPFKLWGYFPVDGHNTHGTLGRLGREVLRGYDRILGYTPYGASVLAKTLDDPTRGIIPDLPHGLDDIWHPRGCAESRADLGWADDDFIVGVVATNQSRKDWGLAAEVGALLAKRFGDRYRQWWHIDKEDNPRAWSVPSLLDEYDLGPATTVSTQQDDDWLARAYSACDVTLAIGAGEGFGLNIIESQACGTPVIHGDYAGGAGLVRYGARIPWKSYRLDGALAIIRPVFEARHWASAAAMTHSPVASMDSFRWKTLWPRWESWFREGLS